MRIEIVGKNGFTPSDANKEYAVDKLGKLEKYIKDFDNVSARVVCKVYKDHHKVEVTIPTKNIMLRAEVTEKDIYAAIDGAIDKLTKQLRRYNDKVKDKLGKTSIRQMDEQPQMPQDVVRSKKLSLEPMTAEEAVDQMELLGHDFFVYLDKETKKTNIVYLREDGHYAIIETEAK